MNTNAFVSFNTLLLVVVYLLVYRFDPDHEENMAKFIPDNALIYFEQRDAKSAVRGFRNTQLGKNFDSINFKSTGEKIGVSEKIIDTIEIIQRYYPDVFENNVINELLGERFALAVFLPKDDLSDFSLEGYLKENSIVVAEPKHNAAILKNTAEHFGKQLRELSFQTIQYGNHQISRVTIPEGLVSFSVIEGLFIASFNEKQLKLSIDAYDGEIKSLFNSDHFEKAQKEFTKPQRFFYLPTEGLKKVVSQLYSFLSPEVKSLVEQQLINTKGFLGISYGAWPTEAIVQEKIIFSYDGKLTNQTVQQHLTTVPSKNSMLDMTIDDPLAYYWSNTIDLKHFLIYLPAETKGSNPIHNYINKLESVSSYSIEQILSILGDEVSLLIEKSGGDNFIPVPLAAAFFRVDPKVDISEIVNYIVDSFEVPVIEQVYNSVTYLYWVASPQDGLQPLCGFWSNLFFIGNSAQLIERVIDGYNENKSLLTNRKIRDIDPGIIEENNSVTYFNNVEILELSQRLLSALGTMASMEDRKKAEKARIIITEVLNPFIEGLKEFERSCTRSYFAPGMVVIDSKTSIATKNTRIEAK